MRRILPYALLLLLCAAGCGAGARPPAAQSPEPVASLTGRERVAWDQELLPKSSITDYVFAVYVNGGRVPLPAATCDSEPHADGFTCSAPLPALPRGASSLEFVAILNGEESERSEPLELDVATGAGRDPAAFQTSQGAPVWIETIARGLRSPTDLAMLPDGRLLITERRGAVRVVAGGTLIDEPALLLDDVADAEGLGMFAVAVHPEFARNRLIYLTYTAKLPDGRAAYRVVRAREINNTLGEVAVILESGLARSPGWMSARFGPDRKLYVGVAACADCGSTFMGVVLRLNDDGTTPRDSQSASPVFVRDVSLPVGLSWRSNQLWIADWNPQSTTIIATEGDRSDRLAAINAGAVSLASPDGWSALLMVRPQGVGLQQYQVRADPFSLAPGAPVLPGSMTVHAAFEAPDGTTYVCASDAPDAPVQLIRLGRAR